LGNLNAAQFPGPLQGAIAQRLQMVTPTVQPPSASEVQEATAAATRANTKNMLPAQVKHVGAETTNISGPGAQLTTAQAAEAKARAANLAGPQAALTGAQAELTGAQGAVERQKLGSPTPGVLRTGAVPADPATDKEMQDRQGQQAVFERNAAVVEKLLGNKDLLTNFEDRANAAAPLARLIGGVKSDLKTRGVPQSVIDFSTSEFGNPLKYDASNVLQIAKNPVRLRAFMDANRQEHQAWMSAHGFAYGPGGNPAASSPAAKTTHYLISPDKKTRIPADSTGKKLGPEEPNPGG
jgi:hypothetical protein